MKCLRRIEPVASRTRQARRQAVPPARQRHAAQLGRRPRRGVEIFEAIIATPILLIATLAIVEFGILLLVEQAIATAAIEGVREASKGADCDTVGDVVEEFLEVHDLAVSNNGEVRVICERRTGGVITKNEVGNPTIPCSVPTTTLIDGEVRVTVCVRASENEHPVPDFLETFGFSLADKTYEISALAKSE